MEKDQLNEYHAGYFRAIQESLSQYDLQNNLELKDGNELLIYLLLYPEHGKEEALDIIKDNRYQIVNSQNERDLAQAIYAHYNPKTYEVLKQYKLEDYIEYENYYEDTFTPESSSVYFLDDNKTLLIFE